MEHRPLIFPLTPLGQQSRSVPHKQLLPPHSICYPSPLLLCTHFRDGPPFLVVTKDSNLDCKSPPIVLYKPRSLVKRGPEVVPWYCLVPSYSVSFMPHVAQLRPPHTCTHPHPCGFVFHQDCRHPFTLSQLESPHFKFLVYAYIKGTQRSREGL